MPRPSNPLQTAILAICAAPMLVFALLGLHARPMTDDFCHIGHYAEMPLWDSILERRNTYNNGNFTNLFIANALGPFGFKIVRIFPAMLIAALFVSQAALLSKALGMLGIVKQRRTTAWALAALLTGAFCASVITRQALYWYTASLKYSAPLVPTTLYLLLLLHAADSARGRTATMRLALAGGTLCFLAAGFAEAFTPPMLLGLSLMIGCAWLAGGIWRMRCLPVLAAGWIGTAACMVILFTAPAVAVRTIVVIDKIEAAERGTSELLSQMVNAWTSHISSPDALAGFALMLAAGALVFSRRTASSTDHDEAPPGFSRLPILSAFIIQLLLAPMLWLHHSDHGLVFGRFSAGYFIVVAINAGLLVGLAFLLVCGRRGARALQSLALPGVGLAILLLLASLTQLRSIHWRAYAYLWLSFHSLLLALMWQQSARLGGTHARRIAVGLACLYTTILLGMALAVASVLINSLSDYTRVYTFLALFNAWLGLCCGAVLGLTLRDGMTRWLVGFTLMAALWLGGGIVAENLALLPKYEMFAKAYDERREYLLAGRAAGERQFTLSPLHYDLPKEIGVRRNHRHRCVLAWYDIEAPVIDG